MNLVSFVFNTFLYDELKIRFQDVITFCSYSNETLEYFYNFAIVYFTLFSYKLTFTIQIIKIHSRIDISNYIRIIVVHLVNSFD